MPYFIRRAHISMPRSMGLLIILSVFCSGCGQGELSLSEMVDRAKVLCERERTDEALDLLKRVTKAAPDNARAYYLTGVVYERQQSLESAKLAYDACLKIDPKYADAWNNRGVVCSRLGDTETAYNDLVQATILNPEDAIAWANLGMAQHDRGQLDLAIASYRRALDHKQNPRYFFQLGNVLLDAKKFSEAETIYDEAIALDTLFAHAYLNRAQACLEQKKWEQATRDLDLAKSNDQELTLRSAIHELRKKILQEKTNEFQWELIAAWLESKGWELNSVALQNGMREATRKLDSRKCEIVLFRMDEQGRATAQGLEARSLANPDSKILIVVDPALMQTSGTTLATEPLWLVQSKFEWTPDPSDFVPLVVAYQPSSPPQLAAPMAPGDLGP